MTDSAPAPLSARRLGALGTMAIAPLSLLLLGAPVAAHAPPEVLALAFPSAGEVAPVVLTSRGLVFAEDGSEHAYSLRCGEAYGVPATNTGALYAVAHDSELLLVTSRGAQTTPDRGCSFTAASGLPAQALGAFAQHPSEPERLLLSTLEYQPERASSLLVSDDYGLSWSERSAIPPGTSYRALVMGPEDRVYAGGNVYDSLQKTLTPVFAISRDGGQSFAASTLPRSRLPIGVHPSDPEIVFARETVIEPGQPARDALLRSTDGGASFEVVRELSSAEAFASTPDGTHVWVGGEDGLYASSDAGKSFQPVARALFQSVRCLRYRAGKLWVCATVASAVSGVWVSDDLGETFLEQLDFTPLESEVTGRVECASDTLQQCDLPWQDYARELLTADAGVPGSLDAGPSAPVGPVDAATMLPQAGDAGVPDAGTLDAAQAPEAGATTVVLRRHDGCSAARMGASGAPQLAWIAAALLAFLRRRARR